MSPANTETECTSKTRLALDALWYVRKWLRRMPPAAVERLTAVDLEGVDPKVVEQVYGEWLRQCARLKLDGAFKYHAAFGRGAVVVADADPDRLCVVSAIGLPGWTPGRIVHRLQLSRLRPLR